MLPSMRLRADFAFVDQPSRREAVDRSGFAAVRILAASERPVRKSLADRVTAIAKLKATGFPATSRLLTSSAPLAGPANKPANTCHKTQREAAWKWSEQVVPYGLAAILLVTPFPVDSDGVVARGTPAGCELIQ